MKHDDYVEFVRAKYTDFLGFSALHLLAEEVFLEVFESPMLKTPNGRARVGAFCHLFGL